MTDFGLSDEQYNELFKQANLYRREAKKCREGKAYLAGCILIGAAFEAILLAMAHCFKEDVFEWAKSTNRLSEKPLIKWSLNELIQAAKQLGWLPSVLSLQEEFDEKRAQIGDYAEAIRTYRNLVHPARYLADFHGKRVTKHYLVASFEIIDTATDYLTQRVMMYLHIASEELDHRQNQS